MAIFKQTYFIYDKENSEPVILEEGFSYAALLGSFVWAARKGLWLQSTLTIVAYALGVGIFKSEVAQFANFIASFISTADDLVAVSFSIILIMLIPNLIFGAMGIEMLQSKLIRDGYELMLTTREFNSEVALNKYNNAKNSEAKKSSAPAKPLPSKESAQTLFIRQKREINRKLKKKLISKKTAEIQMEKARELERMRLIIENQEKGNKVTKIAKTKKTTSKSKNEFDYVEKLKDITALREEGAISQAEFRKLKKKIMDAL